MQDWSSLTQSAVCICPTPPKLRVQYITDRTPLWLLRNPNLFFQRKSLFSTHKNIIWCSPTTNSKVQDTGKPRRQENRFGHDIKYHWISFGCINEFIRIQEGYRSTGPSPSLNKVKNYFECQLTLPKRCRGGSQICTNTASLRFVTQCLFSWWPKSN